MARNRKRVMETLSANIEWKGPRKLTVFSTGIWENSKLECLIS